MKYPTGAAGRSTAVLLAISLVIVVWKAVWQPYFLFYNNNVFLLSNLLDRVKRDRDLISIRDIPHASAQQHENQTVFQPIFIGQEANASSAARLESELTELATRSSIQIQSLDVLPVKQLFGANLVGVQLQFSAPYSGVIMLLNAINSSKYTLFVDELHIIAGQNSASLSPTTLDVSAQVTGVTAGRHN